MTYLLLTYLVITYVTFFVTAIFFVSVMHFKILKDTGRFGSLHWSTKALGYKMLYLGLIADLLLNIALSVPLLELPQWRSGELLTTGRVRRHKFDPSDKLFFGLITSEKMQAYRYKLAIFMCSNYLEPFDSKHCS
jgi:hypothetical protein